MKITPRDAMERMSLNVLGSSKDGAPLEYVRSDGFDDDTVFLVRKGTDGFIIPSDDELDPVLGEAYGADFTLDLHPSMQEWIDAYSNEIEWYQNIGKFIPAPEATTDAVEKEAKDVAALVKTMWSQEYPYNYNLKMEDGKRSIVGCGPLSLGVILYYWYTKGYYRGCTAINAYTTTTNKYAISALTPSATFDYDKITLKKPTAKENIVALSNLLEYCGKSVKADYKPSSTGAYEKDIVSALKNNFRLGNPSLIYAGKLGLAKFCERVRENLADGCPVIVSGFNAKLTGGHCFICDGYRVSDDKFHFNWGWNGKCNGYYKMSALTPTSSRNYSYLKNAIVGIKPDYKIGDVNKDGKINITDLTQAVDASVNGTFKETADINYDGKVDNEDVKGIVDKILK